MGQEDGLSDDDAHKLYHFIKGIAKIEHPTCLAEQLWKPFRIPILNPPITAVCFFILDALFIFSWMCLCGLTKLLTRPGVLLLILSTVYGMIWSISLIMSYPGHLRILKRSMETNYGKLVHKQLTSTCDTCDYLLAILSAETSSVQNRIEFQHHYPEFITAYQESLLPIYTALKYLQTHDDQMNKQAEIFLNVLEPFVLSLGKTLISLERLQSGISSTFENRRKELFHTQEGIEDKDRISLEELSNQLHAIRGAFFTLTEEKITKGGICTICKEYRNAGLPLQAAVNLDLLRADLMVRYNGQQVWIDGEDRNQIDGMFIPSANSESCNNERTVVLCNANAGLYEFHHLQADWINFYSKGGCNVFMFNYRGYGRSTGRPSPQANNSDGESIVRYLRDVRNISQIGVHGESIGGIVATHIANHCPEVQLLVADRTFANLPAVAQRLVAGFAGKALSWVTRWKTDNVTNYMDAKCFKIVCTDPEDEVVKDSSSLKAGIALRIELGDVGTAIPYGGLLTFSSDLKAPHENEKLTEEVIVNFYRALQSLSSIPTLDNNNVKIISKEKASIDDSDGVVDENSVVLEMSSTIDDVTGFRIWSLLACCDGCCGQTLGEAYALGVEGLRVWITCLVVFGPRLITSEIESIVGKNTWDAAQRDLENTRPLSIFSISPTLSQFVYNEQWSSDPIVVFVEEMMRYLKGRIHEDKKTYDEKKEYDVDDKIGHLLPLTCGHNYNLNTSETRQLTTHLRKRGWIN